jgi:uncharacterized YccA/Bax inhibitor family protein
MSAFFGAMFHGFINIIVAVFGGETTKFILALIAAFLAGAILPRISLRISAFRKRRRAKKAASAAS